MPQVLAVAVLIEAWSEAAGQHHGIEDGDVDEDADAAPDGAVGSDLHAAPGLQPQEVLVVAVLQAKICRLVVLHLEVIPADAGADHRRRVVHGDLGRRRRASGHERSASQRPNEYTPFHSLYPLRPEYTPHGSPPRKRHAQQTTERRTRQSGG